MKEQDNRRYPIGPFEYGQEYSFDDTRRHIKALDRFPKELKKAVKKLKGNDLDKPYRSGGWTIRQVVHHIADSHMNAYIRMKLAVTENTPIIKPYEEQLWAETEDGLHGPVKMSLKLLSALHVRWVEFLESLSEEDLERGYYHPSSKRTVQMQEAIALYIWHSQHHLHHIRLVSEGKSKIEATTAPAMEALDTNGQQAMPKRRGPKPKQQLPAGNADAKPKKRGMSDEHKDKIRAAHQARRAAKAGEAMPVPPSEGKRTRRTQAQMAADRAVTPPATERRKPGPKPRAARMENADTAPDGVTSTRRPKRGLLHNIMDAILPGKRKRRTQAEMAAERAVVPTTERKKPGPKPKAAAPESDAGTPATTRRKRRTQSEMAADRSAAETTQASGERRKPGRPAQPKADKSATDAPKKRGMSAEHMAKIREARMAKRADAIASGAVTPKAKKEKATSDDGTPKKRGMSAEHMAKIREARMSKRADAIASGAVTPKAKKEKATSDDGAPKKRGMSAEHMAKIREARVSKRAEAIASGAVTPKAKKEKAADDGAPKKRGMSAEHMAKIREARISKRADAIASGAVTPKAKKEKAADDGAPKKRGMNAEHMAKIRAMRTDKKS